MEDWLAPEVFLTLTDALTLELENNSGQYSVAERSSQQIDDCNFRIRGLKTDEGADTVRIIEDSGERGPTRINIADHHTRIGAIITEQAILEHGHDVQERLARSLVGCDLQIVRFDIIAAHSSPPTIAIVDFEFAEVDAPDQATPIDRLCPIDGYEQWGPLLNLLEDFEYLKSSIQKEQRKRREKARRRQERRERFRDVLMPREADSESEDLPSTQAYPDHHSLSRKLQQQHRRRPNASVSTGLIIRQARQKDSPSSRIVSNLQEASGRKSEISEGHPDESPTSGKTNPAESSAPRLEGRVGPGTNTPPVLRRIKSEAVERGDVNDVTIPEEQTLLLARKDSWLPPETGYAEPVANVPINILKEWNDEADLRKKCKERLPSEHNDAMRSTKEAGEVSDQDSDSEGQVGSDPWPNSPECDSLPPDSDAEGDDASDVGTPVKGNGSDEHKQQRDVDHAHFQTQISHVEAHTVPANNTSAVVPSSRSHESTNHTQISQSQQQFNPSPNRHSQSLKSSVTHPSHQLSSPPQSNSDLEMTEPTALIDEPAKVDRGSKVISLGNSPFTQVKQTPQARMLGSKKLPEGGNQQDDNVDGAGSGSIADENSAVKSHSPTERILVPNSSSNHSQNAAATQRSAAEDHKASQTSCVRSSDDRAALADGSGSKTASTLPIPNSTLKRAHSDPDESSMQKRRCKSPGSSAMHLPDPAILARQNKKDFMAQLRANRISARGTTELGLAEMRRSSEPTTNKRLTERLPSIDGDHELVLASARKLTPSVDGDDDVEFVSSRKVTPSSLRNGFVHEQAALSPSERSRPLTRIEAVTGSDGNHQASTDVGGPISASPLPLPPFHTESYASFTSRILSAALNPNRKGTPQAGLEGEHQQVRSVGEGSSSVSERDSALPISKIGTVNNASHRVTPSLLVETNKIAAAKPNFEGPNPILPTGEAIYEKYKAAYTGYHGNYRHFSQLCQRLAKLVEAKILHRSLWDDFVFRHTQEYKIHINDCLQSGDDPIPYKKFYDEIIEEPLCGQRVLNVQSLKAVLGKEDAPTKVPQTSDVYKSHQPLMPLARPAPSLMHESIDHTTEEPQLTNDVPDDAPMPSTKVVESHENHQRHPLAKRQSLPWSSSVREEDGSSASPHTRSGSFLVPQKQILDRPKDPKPQARGERRHVLRPDPDEPFTSFLRSNQAIRPGNGNAFASNDRDQQQGKNEEQGLRDLGFLDIMDWCS